MARLEIWCTDHVPNTSFQEAQVAFVLRNVWVWVHAEMIAQLRRGGRRLMSVSLRFARLLLWLVVEVARQYRLLREISVYRDMYQVAQEFGVTFNY